MEIECWQEEDGFNPYQSWLKDNPEGASMAESMVMCLKIMDWKCKFVKDLNLEGLCELRSKSQKVRVYFFLNKNRDTAYITGVGYKTTQKKDIIDSYNRMKGARYG